MASTDRVPFFSVVIPTRDRPETFQTALNSVLGQSFSNIELIVVVDGSTTSNLAEYRILEQLHEDILFLYLAQRPSGHGQSYAMNYGVEYSSGQYVCFLDDDDNWIDERYLDNVHSNLSASEKPVDVHYSNQKAFYADGIERVGPVWIEGVIPTLKPKNSNSVDSYFVDAELLLSCNSFAHLNCSIFRREFYTSIGGMDETIRYENDRDIYLRAIDTAKIVLFSTNYTSRHNIPDVNKKSNMSTISSDIEKKLSQMRIYDRGISLGKSNSVVAFCRNAKMYELKNIARILVEKNNYVGAVHFAKEALVIGFTFRWLAYTVYLYIQNLRKRI